MVGRSRGISRASAWAAICDLEAAWAVVVWRCRGQRHGQVVGAGGRVAGGAYTNTPHTTENSCVLLLLYALTQRLPLAEADASAFGVLVQGMVSVVDKHALEASTKSTRATAFAQWEVFCALHGLGVLRTGSSDAEAVVAAAFLHWLTTRPSKVYRKVKGAKKWGPIEAGVALGYLSAVVRHVHDCLKYAWAPPRHLATQVAGAAAKARTKASGVERFVRKLPITINLLRWALVRIGYDQQRAAFLEGSSVVSGQKLIVQGAAAVHAWCTLSRLGDFLQRSHSEPFDANRRPTSADVRFEVRGRVLLDPSTATLRQAYPDVKVLFRVKCSKADQSGKVWGNFEIKLSARATDVACPVLAHIMLREVTMCAFALRATVPLFRVLHNGVMVPFRRDDLRTSVVKHIQTTYGRAHTGHSFRVGGACALCAAGVPMEHIKILGRWRSDAIDMYVRTYAGGCADALQRMASVDAEQWHRFDGLAHDIFSL